MILQSLCAYYADQVKAGDPDYAPAGMELKRIHFVLVLSPEGLLCDIEQLTKKVSVAKSRARGGRDACLMANHMWDNVGFVLGYGESSKQQDQAFVQHRSFTTLVDDFHAKYPENATFAAVSAFYKRSMDVLRQHALWSEIIERVGQNITFRLLGEPLLAAQQPELLHQLSSGDTYRGECLLMGKRTDILRIHPKIYLHGGVATGAKLVSFMQKSGYDSYHKRGGENAPISIEMAEAYAAALTGMLQQGSSHNVVISNLSFLFFTLPNSDFSELFRLLIDPKEQVDRSQVLEQLNALTETIDEQAEFVVVGIIPNAARISIRLFHRTTVREVGRNIRAFYEEIALKNHTNEVYFISVLQPLFSISPNSNIDKLSPQLIVDYFQSVLKRSPFPVPLQIELLSRLRRSRELNYTTIMMMRCYLNRIFTLQPISMSLNLEMNNTGYLLGRLFAIMERGQELSQPGITYTLRDAYYASASVTPSAVFNRLIVLSNTHFRRITAQSTSIYLKKQLGEVMSQLHSGEIPVRLTLDDQCRFALGYFHQRQIYFIKNESQDEQYS